MEWGYGGLKVGYLFSRLANGLTELSRKDDPQGTANSFHIKKMGRECRMMFIATQSKPEYISGKSTMGDIRELKLPRIHLREYLIRKQPKPRRRPVKKKYIHDENNMMMEALMGGL